MDNERKYPWTDHWGVRTLGTLRDYAAQTIDTGWHYSWYWGNKPDSDWRMDALSACMDRIKDTRAELESLEACAQALSTSINENPPYGTGTL